MKKTLMTALLAVAFIFTLSLTSVNEAYASDTVRHTDDDYSVLPDKYNTGANPDYLTSVSVEDAAALKAMYGGLPFKKSTDSLLVINFHGNRTISGEIYIDNLDFSDQGIAIYNTPLCQNPLRIVFTNCKFSSFGMRDENDLVTFEFRNCTFKSICGSNMDLYNCYVGGGQSDGIRAFNNANIVNCYVADKSQVNGTMNVGNHVDGTQIYGTKDGTCKNIHFTNCRFEIPKIVGSTAPINACLMLQIEFCDADDITFRNCKINGGGYSIYAWSKNNTYELTNAVFEDIKVGCANKFGTIYPRKGKDVTFTNIEDSDSLYVGSVWKDWNGTHLSVTNDTNTVRTLSVHTNYGEQTFTIDACPLYTEMVEGITFTDLPFDIDIEIGDCDWVVCYDITDGTEKQIRYVNYTGKEVYVSNGQLTTEEEINPVYTSYASSRSEVPSVETDDVYDNEPSLSGKCGNNATWILSEDGTLFIEGTGNMYDFHSGKKSPWEEYSNVVTNIVIGEGITKIGNQAFRDFKKLESVELPSTLKSIGSIAFQKCSSLKTIVLPESLTSIGDRCFAGDTFETVIYLGNDWESVSVGNYNTSLLSAMNK